MHKVLPGQQMSDVPATTARTYKLLTINENRKIDSSTYKYCMQPNTVDYSVCKRINRNILKRKTFVLKTFCFWHWMKFDCRSVVHSMYACIDRCSFDDIGSRWWITCEFLTARLLKIVLLSTTWKPLHEHKFFDAAIRLAH